MLSATFEQVEQVVNKIVKYSRHLSSDEQMALVKNHFLNTVGSYHIAEEIFRWIDDMKYGGINYKILKTGNSAPDFTLADVSGKVVSLKKYLRRGPAVLIFYPGNWCPFSSLFLKMIQNKRLEFFKLKTSVIALSPQTPDNLMAVADRYNLEFELLSDIGNMVARRFGLVYRLPDNIMTIYQYMDIFLSSYNGDDSAELPVAATYVINSSGIIARAFIDIDFMHRPDPDSIIDVLADLK